MNSSRSCSKCANVCAMVVKNNVLAYECMDCNLVTPIQNGSVLAKYETTRQTSIPYAHTSTTAMAWGADCIHLSSQPDSINE